MKHCPSPMLLVMALMGSAMAPLSGATIYSLNTLALDGSPGENTYIVTNGQASTLSGSLVFNTAASSAYSYFLGYFSPATLNLGDSLVLNYSFTRSSVPIHSNPSSFRVGFFNGNGEQMTANSSTTGSSALNDDTGYAARYGTGSTVAEHQFYQRTGTSDLLWQSSTLSQISTLSPALASIGSGDVIGSFSLTRTAGGVEISSTINGTTQSYEDTTTLLTSFDYFSIFAISGNENGEINFSNLSVDYVPVPEPGTGALVAGTLLAALLRSRRRR